MKRILLYALIFIIVLSMFPSFAARLESAETATLSVPVIDDQHFIPGAQSPERIGATVARAHDSRDREEFSTAARASKVYDDSFYVKRSSSLHTDRMCIVSSPVRNVDHSFSHIVMASSKSAFEALGGEGHAWISFFDVWFDDVYAYVGDTCYIEVQVYNNDAGLLGANLYVRYKFYDYNGVLKCDETSATHYVYKGEYYTFPIKTKTLGETCLPYTGCGPQDKIELELWWDDSGNHRLQDSGKSVQFSVLAHCWFHGVGGNPLDSNGDCLYDGVECESMVWTEGGTMSITVKGYLYDMYNNLHDSGSKDFTITDKQSIWLYGPKLYVDYGGPVGQYHYYMEVYDKCTGMLEDTTLNQYLDPLYPPDYDPNEEIDESQLARTAFDSDGDGYNDAVHVNVDVDTEFECYTETVTVRAYLYDPSGSQVDDDYDSWQITGSNDEVHTLDLYVPSDGEVGYYDVEVKVWDGSGHFEDSVMKYDWVHLYPPGATEVLNVEHKVQRKDTYMLCLGWGSKGEDYEGDLAWDKPHPDDIPHETGSNLDDVYCARASISMIASYYGGSLSQDRISYYHFGDGEPEGDLGCGRGIGPDYMKGILEWALDDCTVTYINGKPSFSEIEQWIDSDRPILRRHVHAEGAHYTVIDGYDAYGERVRIIDPWISKSELDGEPVYWKFYSDLPVSHVWVPPASATARSDESTIWMDSDNDGIYDFEEIYRFGTDRYNSDTDGDGVHDKQEIISYTFLTDQSYDADDLRKPDPDTDDFRCEVDFDSDNGGVQDGSEDKNGNGFVDPGETDPLDPSDDPNAIHLESSQDNAASYNLGTIEFDSSTYSLPNDITKPAGTYPIRYISAPGYVFDRWESTLGITVADPNARSTTAIVSGAGTLRAIYALTPVHNLNTGLNYTTIQAAIDATETLDGHTIQVDAGIYYEHVIVNKSVALVGEDEETTIIDGSRTGIVIRASHVNNVTISGFTIQNSGYEGGAIWLDHCNGSTICKNTVTSNGENGILLEYSKNNSIYNNKLSNNRGLCGIELYYSEDNSVYNNTVTNNWFGVYVSFSNHNTISYNVVTDNTEDGIHLSFSKNNILRFNRMTRNGYNLGIWAWGIYFVRAHFFHDIDTSNTVDGKPVYYLINQSNLVIDPTTFPDIGYLAIINSVNITVRNLILANNREGILLAYTTNSAILNVTTHNNYWGVWLHFADRNKIGNNRLNDYAYGFMLEKSNLNLITNNNVINNSVGIRLDDSEANRIYNNNFINNNRQAQSFYSINVWDDGYPSGGNYWSDYNGNDTYSGSHQNETGSDGIGDTLYTINGTDQDNYPLMKPWTPPDIAIVNVTTSKTVVGQGYSLYINVTVQNEGNKIEAFNVSVFYDNTAITLPDGKNHTTTTLTSLNSTTLTIPWNTTGTPKGNYTIKAKATPLPGETDTLDNTLTNGWIIIAMTGDITGGTPDPLDFVPDGKVDMKDIATIARYFGQNVPPAPSNCDITGPTTGVPDGTIDMRDVATAARHYGETDP